MKNQLLKRADFSYADIEVLYRTLRVVMLLQFRK